jgi:membrane protein
MLKERLVSFGMVLVAGSLLVVSLTLDTVLAGFSGALGSRLSALPDLIQLVELLRTLRFVKFLFSFGVFTLLFAFIYKAVPDAEVAWKDVWIGGAATSLLFTGGNLLIGIYLGRSSVGSAYGAAGSLVALLVWVYYSAQVFFFGAEFTQVYAEIHGSRILPDEDAVALVREERTRQEVFGMMRPRLMRLGRKKAKEEEAVETEEADMPTEVEVSAIAEDARSNRDHLLKYGGAAAGVLGLLAGAIAVISRIKDER